VRTRTPGGVGARRVKPRRYPIGRPSLRAAPDFANGDQIAIADSANILGLQCHEGLGSAGGGHELHFEGATLMDLDHSTKVTAAEPKFCEVVF